MLTDEILKELAQLYVKCDQQKLKIESLQRQLEAEVLFAGVTFITKDGLYGYATRREAERWLRELPLEICRAERIEAEDIDEDMRRVGEIRIRRYRFCPDLSPVQQNTRIRERIFYEEV